jgi:hypothetical protein
MKIPELQQLAKRLEEPAHLVVWEASGRIEVVALGGETFEDAFPLPLTVQSAGAEAGMILDTTTAARLELSQLPDDFWDSLLEVNYGECLRVSMLGRAGKKYLHAYRAVREGASLDQKELEELALSEFELLQIARWMREQALFGHQSGEVIMDVFTRLRV